MSNRDLRNLAIFLILISATIYCTNYLIFHNAHDIFFYMMIDLGFLPLSVLLVTIVVDRLLAERERQAQRYKMNMVISAFFSAVGTPLLRALGDLVPEEQVLCEHLSVDPTWDEKRLRGAIAYVQETRLAVRATPDKLRALRQVLAGHREFLLRLVENPVLLEHQQFTDLLWAVFHLEEELTARAALENCPAPDLDHLAHDADRALGRLLTQWLEHLIHLQKDYPYLYSFEARTNPLRAGAKAEVV
jgi:hypothetical protein